MALSIFDYLIIILYFGFVLGIGYFLKKAIKTSDDYFLSGRSIPAWITGIAFIAANLGALEVMGMVANSAKYGILTAHFYWIGAIPAMAFVGVFMMPFYYGSKARSVPEYLRLRFDEKTRGFNAISFAVLTLLMSGINMYAMGIIFKLLLGWSFHFSVIVSAVIVLLYVFFGGLTSSIYNEVLQFLLIVFGLFPISYLGLREVGGWDELVKRLPDNFTHLWSTLSSASQNPMGIEWFGMIFGLGFVLSFGYWCTDFLVVQRALASKDINAARRTPLIGAFPKMLFPFFVVLPGMIAILVIPEFKTALDTLLKTGHTANVNYNMALPLLIKHYLPRGLLGLGLTALLASFMSGMAGNVTAFNTVWTFDIYQSYIRPGKDDKHYLWMGKMATVFGVLVSIALTYIVMYFNNLMDYMQLLFSFFNAPLFATFLLGMFWKRATSDGAFWGLVSGTSAAAAHYFLIYKAGIIHYGSEMSANFYGAIVAWVVCFLTTIIISYMTKPKPDEEMVKLVYSLTPKEYKDNIPFYLKPGFLAAIVLISTLILNIIFW